MNAKIENGIAVLEEFLQEKYVENYGELSDENNKIIGLLNIEGTSKYFYKPSVGVLKYVVDSEGHALYLINKKGLPNDIKDVLVGGEAGNGEYSDYLSLNDVYGVTENLKVYYCSSGIDSIMGVARDELDFDDSFREIFPESSFFAELVTGGRSTTLEDVKNVTNLDLDGSSLTDLKDIYNFIVLGELTLKNYTGSLSGIENTSILKKIKLVNCNISDYSPIGKLGSKLERLYLVDVDNSEVAKMCTKSATGIGKYDLKNLKYFGVVRK